MLPGVDDQVGPASGGRIGWAIAAVLAVVLLVPAIGVALVLVVVMGAAGSAGGVQVVAPGAVRGLSPVLLDAYTRAAAAAPSVAPGCTGVRWSILAGIAQIESGQASGRTISATGDVTPPIIGPALDGSGAGGNTTAIRDSDGGRWDHDRVFDRAVGVLQFIPSSWRIYGRDGNRDGVLNPHNVYDNALGSVVHLCGTGRRNLADPSQMQQALFGYNRSTTYVTQVTGWITQFDQLGAEVAPGGSGSAATSARAAKVIAAARTKLGRPYVWGATGPDAFDCSGLTGWAYAQIGVRLPRVSRDQFNAGTRIPRTAGVGALQPGDLVFFASNPATGAGVHHVGIYLGAGQMINAPNRLSVVREEPLWMDSYAGGVRP